MLNEQIEVQKQKNMSIELNLVVFPDDQKPIAFHNQFVDYLMFYKKLMELRLQKSKKEGSAKDSF